MPATFDGDNLIITLPSGTPEIDAKVDLYSDWKEWFKTGTNSKYPLAFDTTGGDPTTATGAVSSYYFLRNENGWRIAPAEEDGEVTIIGNLYPRDSALPLFMTTVGAFTVLITIERDASSVVETIVSGSGLSVAQDAKLTSIDAQLASIENGYDHLQVMRILLASAAGKLIIDPDGTVRIRDLADKLDRIATPTDVNGQRLGPVLDVADAPP